MENSEYATIHLARSGQEQSKWLRPAIADSTWAVFSHPHIAKSSQQHLAHWHLGTAMDNIELAVMEMGMAPWRSRARTGEKHHGRNQKCMAHSATEKETKADLPWTLNQNASSAVNIGTTARPIKNIRGTASAAAANHVLRVAGAAKLSPQAALQNQAGCCSKSIALKTRRLFAAHSKEGAKKQGSTTKK